MTLVRSYYELDFVGVYSVVTKIVESVSGYTVVFKIKGQCTFEGFGPMLSYWVW